MRFIRTIASTALFVAFAFSNPAIAGPPTIGKSTQGNGWLSAINPTNWEMPSMPWSKEPPRIQKKKSTNIMSAMNASTKRTWTRTKNALDPSRMFEPSSRETKPISKTSENTGFFNGLFGGTDEPRDVRTVNDFLSLPQPKQ